MNDALLAGIEAHIGDGSQSVVEEVSVDDVAHEIIVSCIFY